MAEAVDVWALVDHRAGHASQVLGVASKLGLPYTIKSISYSPLAALPNRLLGRTGLSISSESLQQLKAPWPKVVIAAGRRTAPVAQYIKSKSPNTLLVQLMWPGEPADAFDVIAVPEHDNLHSKHPGIVRTIAALHSVSESMLSEAREKWEPFFAEYPRPRVSMLVGGSSKHGKFSADDYRIMASRAQKLAGDGSLLISTSRRTDKEAERLLQSVITIPHFLYCWDDKQENPYYGLLACADILVVSGDSISMVSEASFTGKPLYIYMPEHACDAKITRFTDTLFDHNIAKPLLNVPTEQWKPQSAQDDAVRVVEAIRKKM